MRVFLATFLPLVAFASPTPHRPLIKRADMRPYSIDVSCEVADSRFPNVDFFAKADNAVKGVANLAELAWDEWWYQKKYDEVASTYLALDKARRRDRAATKDMINNANSYIQFVNDIYWNNKFNNNLPPRRPEAVKADLQCIGGGEKYVNQVVDANIQDFCTRASESYHPSSDGRTYYYYNKGTPEEDQFEPHSYLDRDIDGRNVYEQCIDVMPQIIHGCDKQSQWKYGGAIYFNQADGKTQYEYSIAPQKDRPTPIPDKVSGKCDVWYKFPYYDEFFIYGAQFAATDFGQDKLLPNLRRCGVVSEWAFDYQENPDGTQGNYEWRAYGRIPIGAQQWDCVRQAVVNAGGPSDIGCGGK
ncbi:hypothetical protein EK21DRAFT_106011 [Setomelanomma holmii]|uniref:Uncharacterized protein n=1 Tax=Setomelanomma holmii TaxID=210430 RepID=A0A9P4HP05_9PLEO|nr:hypothetical protein EK21DRAFT_106011 [Setomelanomma holmii]